MGWIKSFLNRDTLDGANRRLHKMKPEDITKRVQREWRSYVKWRRLRRRLSSWYLNKVLKNKLAKLLIVPLVIIILLGCLSGLCIITVRIFPHFLGLDWPFNCLSYSVVFIPILIALFINVSAFLHDVFYSLDMDKQHNSMKAFFELHPHDLIARLHKPIKDSNFFEKNYDDLDNFVDNLIVKLPDYVYNDIPPIYNIDDFQKTETIEEEDSVSYGTMKILYNMFLHLLNASFRDPLRKVPNWSNKTKTFELIHFMWNKNHVPLKFNILETGRLVRAWSDLSVGRLSWDEYYGMVDAMTARVEAEADIIVARDRKEVIDRLMDLKHDSEVMNDSQSLTRMRDLVGRLHESSTELTGKTVTQ